jgi:hypothetical protein
VDIACERCGAPIPAADVNLDARLAKCRACNAVFDFTTQLRKASAEAPLAAVPDASLQRRRPPVPMPEGITIVEDEGGDPSPGDYREAPARPGRLVISRSWFNNQLFFMLFFCIAWDAFLVFWYSTATRGPSSFSIIAIVFPIAHVAVGVGLTYRTLAGFLNKTWITVTPEALTIRHKPLPWRGNRTIPASELEQLYCEESVSNDKDGSSSRTYKLSAWLKDGRKLELLASLPSPDQALFLEQRIEDRLGIVDAPVGGEYRA